MDIYICIYLYAQYILYVQITLCMPSKTKILYLYTTDIYTEYKSMYIRNINYRE